MKRKNTPTFFVVEIIFVRDYQTFFMPIKRFTLYFSLDLSFTMQYTHGVLSRIKTDIKGNENSWNKDITNRRENENKIKYGIIRKK